MTKTKTNNVILDESGIEIKKTLEEVMNEYIGKKGTKAREDFEEDLKNDIIETFTKKKHN